MINFDWVITTGISEHKNRYKINDTTLKNFYEKTNKKILTDIVKGREVHKRKV